MSAAAGAQSVRQSLAEATAALKEAGIEAPARDARLLLAAALGVDPSRISMLISDPMPAQAAFSALIARRMAHEPVSKILGRRDFYGRSFRITADVLDPRPDTEALIELALAAPFERVLDLGTGSGCILLTLLAEMPQASGIGTDVSTAALAVATENAQRLGLGARARFAAGSWFSALSEVAPQPNSGQNDSATGTQSATFEASNVGEPQTMALPERFDLIVSNPPYIAEAEMAGLDPDVLRFDPYGALSDGADGLSAYREIAGSAAQYLRHGGRLIVEIGWQQGPAVSDLFKGAGFQDVTVTPDLAGRDRVVSGTSKG